MGKMPLGRIEKHVTYEAIHINTLITTPIYYKQTQMDFAREMRCQALKHNIHFPHTPPIVRFVINSVSGINELILQTKMSTLDPYLFLYNKMSIFLNSNRG